MRNSLLWKLTFAFVLVAVTTAALVAVFVRVTSADRLSRLIEDQERTALLDAATNYYLANGSWDGIALNLLQYQPRPDGQAPAQSEPFVPAYRPPSEREGRHLFGLADAQGIVVVPAEPELPLGARVPAEALQAGTPLLVDGVQVGTILSAHWQPGFNPAESLFLQRTNEALLLAVIVAVLVALGIGLLLARTLIAPLQALTHAAQGIAQGKLGQRVEVGSKDEIGRLAAAFNRMSCEVERSNQMRRQMTADIAHDLRTPLTVVAGYIESMQDGVLEATPERLSLIYGEIEQLQTLVGDLRMLSQADAGELRVNSQPLAPRSLLAQAAAVFAHHAEQHNITLKVEAEDDLPEVQADEARMMRVLGNLLSNALRYTLSGGRITLSACRSAEGVVLTVADNGVGIAPDELPFIFERFHRADKSRHTASGETGLGLAIVRALVEAHGGSVAAESTLGEGTAIHLTLSVAPAPAA